MEILESREKVCRFYREHTGIDITAYGRTVSRVFEGLYYHKSKLTYGGLLQKMADCGIKVSYGSLDRVRYESLCRKVKPEPASLTVFGSRFWYLSQAEEFLSSDLSFMMKYSAEETVANYPNLQAFLSWTQRRRYRHRGYVRNSRANARRMR